MHLFIYVFLHKKDISWKIKSIFTLLLAPVLLLATTNLNLSGFDLATCDAFQYEGEYYTLYYNLLGLLAILWTSTLLVKNYRKADRYFKKQIVLMGIGLELFLFLFVTIFYLAQYLTSIGFIEDSRLELYGFFGMTFFMAMMGTLIVRFKTFNVGMVASQALLIVLVILTASQFTYVASRTGTVITAVTLVFTAIIGIILVRSVKKEIAQRAELLVLTGKLEKANVRLKDLDKLKSEYVSIASHQLRSPLTAIRGYASLLREGNYGKIPVKGLEALERIEDSSKANGDWYRRLPKRFSN